MTEHTEAVEGDIVEQAEHSSDLYDVAVVKVGTNSITDEEGHIDLDSMQSIADGIRQLEDQGKKVVLITSAAVSVGVSKLGWEQRPEDHEIARLQHAAAVGNPTLFHHWEQSLGKPVAQILVTNQDLATNHAWGNLGNLLGEIFGDGSIAVMNQNDATDVSEMPREIGKHEHVFDDNDLLAARVAGAIGRLASVGSVSLTLLTDRDGVEFDGDVMRRIGAEEIVQRMHEIVQETDEVPKASRGGMKSKLRAGLFARLFGVETFIGPAYREHGLVDIMMRKIGTEVVARAADVELVRRIQPPLLTYQEGIELAASVRQ